MRRCRQCVMPENFPHITFDSHGICNLCAEYEGQKKRKRLLQKEYRERFRRLIAKYAGKKEYDILMCYSGGKDSTYTLSILKNIYRLNILAFTFDNGFIPNRTYVNIRNVVERLDVDHILFKPRFEILKRIFKKAMDQRIYSAKALERASGICTSCMGLVKYTAMKVAVEKDIPFICFGWSPGQAPVTSSVLTIDPRMIRSMEQVFKQPMIRMIGKDIERYFLSESDYSRAKVFPTFIHPLAFHEYNEKKVVRYIKGLGWLKPQGIDFNATNCLLNSLADEVHIKKYKFHPYALEIAGLVREGYMTRNEGLRHMPVEKNKKVVTMVKRKLGV